MVSVGMALALVVRCLDLFWRGLGGEWEGGGVRWCLVRLTEVGEVV